jgi:hypothetical protein
MAKTLARATLITSCDNSQQAAWFAAYLTACQYQAEARGNAVYAVDMNVTQVSCHWANFVTNWQPRLRNRRDDMENAERKLAAFGFDLALAQGDFLRTPSATNYSQQQRMSLKFQEAYQAEDEARAAFRHALSFAELAEETKTRLAHNARLEEQYRLLAPSLGKADPAA